jgi:hypothetical protein
MRGFGAWLLTMVQPILGKILVALGFQVVTITGVTVAIDQVKGLWLQHMHAVPQAGLQIATLAGIDVCMGMIFGAITFRITLWQIQQSIRVLGVKQ